MNGSLQHNEGDSRVYQNCAEYYFIRLIGDSFHFIIIKTNVGAASVHIHIINKP